MDRETFMRQLAEDIEKNNIQVASELHPDMVIICTRATDFNPKDNAYWHIEDNKSYPRDVHCSACQVQVVMSGWMYRSYKAQAEPKCRVLCQACVVAEVKKMKETASEPVPDSSPDPGVS